MSLKKGCSLAVAAQLRSILREASSARLPRRHTRTCVYQVLALLLLHQAKRFLYQVLRFSIHGSSVYYSDLEVISYLSEQIGIRHNIPRPSNVRSYESCIILKRKPAVERLGSTRVLRVLQSVSNFDRGWLKPTDVDYASTADSQCS